jgi:hypothetical protein
MHGTARCRLRRILNQQELKLRADAQVARNEAETAKRDAQLAKAEVERLSAEAASLNSALERLQTEKNEARMMEFVVDGAIIILMALIAIISSIIFINRRKAIAGKADGVGPEATLSGMIGDSPIVETQRASDGGASQAAKIPDTILTSLEPAQFLPNATAPKNQNGSAASDAISTSEERVTLPI